ncbi:hypothetical protein PG990_004936 [Apiospora arundinis]
MMLDPDLKYAGLSTEEPSQWYTHGFQRLPLPPDGTQYFMNPAFSVRHPNGAATPMPSHPTHMLGRQTTPSDHASSASSRALSPGSSDNAPSTPSDETDYSFHAQCAPWGTQTQSQMVQLTGMSDGVKLGDVNSLEDDVLHGFPEEKTITELPIRSYTMSSMGSSYEMDQINHSEPINFARQASPTNFTPDVKEEIRIPDSYPPPEPEDDDTTSIEDVEPAPQPAQDDYKDQDYKPTGSQRRASNAKRSRKRNSVSQSAPQPKRIKAESRSLSNKNMPADKPLIPGSAPSHRCHECPDVTFKDETGLQNHIQKKHTRPFTCVFAFAGCSSTFAAKNEWKRHVASQHLLLFYWLCSQDSCTKLSNSSSSPSHSCHNSPDLPNGAIFNRKDLYTQHVRRMHVPLSVKKQLKQKTTIPEWEDRVQVLQKEAHKPRCSLPEYMTCPALGCTTMFNGPGAWDERMEHVAKHLEKAANGHEERIVFGGHNDPTLTEWAARPDVAVIVADRTRGWILNNPLKPEKNANKHIVRSVINDEDEDAEGEEVDEF